MADVKCLKKGGFAERGQPHLPPVRFKEGNILRGISDSMAERIIELGFGEKIDELFEDPEPVENGSGDDTEESGNGKKMPWQK